MMMNANAIPMTCEVFVTAVANVLCLGGNQTALSRGGVIITGRPTIPTMI